MPELPDVTVYVEHLRRRVVGATLEKIVVLSPNLLRTVEPPLESMVGRRVREVRRLGKRIVIGLDRDGFLVLHLMISGRLHWKPRGARLGRKMGLAVFEFTTGALTWTEASTRKRASLHVVAGASALAGLDPGGLEPLDAPLEAFAAALTAERHTLKRSLTDPRVLSGVGNAYSDEILHRARLSPFRLTTQLEPDEMARLHTATREVLVAWTDRLRAETGEAFPEHVTAFRDGMAVHGRYRQPCPECGAPVQRVAYADNELNYCARCQTGGRLLADRALSKLLREDWPKTLEELEEATAARRQRP
ncbi:MAG: DNA-formamidopyrimidine glycosylase family protein [Candidatus Eisenbacteria bacterium]